METLADALADPAVLVPVPRSGSVPEGFAALDADAVGDFLRERHAAVLADALGGRVDAVREISDGNLNHVFEVVGARPDMRICVKQALPFMRMDKTIEMACQRVYFEHASLQIFARVPQGPGHSLGAIVPAVLAFDETYACVLLEFVAPHQVLRAALVGGATPAGVGAAAGAALAGLLFATSVYGLEAPLHRRLVRYFASNDELCVATEEAFFTSPFVERASFPSRWSSPALDDAVRAIRSDPELLLAVADLKARFVNHGECLLHGDLHTGSVLVDMDEASGWLADRPGALRFFDSEFALVGPMAFDIGSFIGNLVMSACAHRSAFALHEARDFWDAFASRFGELWGCEKTKVIEATSQPGALETGRVSMFLRPQAGPVTAPTALAAPLADIWADAIGFAAVEMIRRTIGVAHVQDFEEIADAEERARAESAALRIAQRILRDRRAERRLASFDALMDLCQSEIEIAAGKAKPQSATLYLVARFPRLGSCKTRLAATIGQNKALDFARACIADLVDDLGSERLERELGATVHRVILFSPAQDHDEYRAWLDARCPRSGPAWALEPMSSVTDPDVRLGKLGSALGGALERTATDAVAFIGMDTPHIGVEQVCKALAVPLNDPERALLAPALDGGYVILALAGALGKRAFYDVAWSTGAAFATQLAAVSRCGVRVQVGDRVFRDVDEEDDYKSLRDDLEKDAADSKGLCKNLCQHFFPGST